MMWFDGVRQPNTLYIASVSRGKDSTAMLRAIQLMGWPLDAICSVDIWFDDETPAELPPMVEFKAEWDAKCEELFGIPVTRLCATKREREREKERDRLTQDTSIAQDKAEGSAVPLSVSQCNGAAGARNSNTSKLTYCDIFYRPMKPKGLKRERERESKRLAAAEGQLVSGPTQREYLGQDSQRGGVSIARANSNGRLYGFPIVRGNWCTTILKQAPQ